MLGRDRSGKSSRVWGPYPGVALILRWIASKPPTRLHETTARYAMEPMAMKNWTKSVTTTP